MNTMETVNRQYTVDTHTAVARAMVELSALVRSIGLYDRGHPVAGELVHTAHRALVNLLVTQATVVVGVDDNCLGIDRFVIEDQGGCLAAFAAQLSARRVTEIRLRTGLTTEELLDFAETAAMSAEDLLLRGGIQTELQKLGVQNIEVGEGNLPQEFREGKDPADIYEEALVLVEEAMKAIQSGLRIPVPEIRSVVADSLHSLVADESALLALAGIRSYDRYLSEHSVNVCLFSMVLARDLHLDAATTLEVGISAMLHDVGKIFVKSRILQKAGQLTESEWQEMRKHPADGARVLAGLQDLPALASTIALEHHAYCDGSGYPDFQLNRQTHLLSRLVAIIDTYDALTTQRPYRKRWSPVHAIAYMLYETPGRYDRKLLARFASRAKLYPIGALVRLVGGDIAVVVGGSSADPENPRIRVVDGPSLKSFGKTVVDLSVNHAPSMKIECMAHPVEALLPYTEKLVAA